MRRAFTASTEDSHQDVGEPAPKRPRVAAACDECRKLSPSWMTGVVSFEMLVTTAEATLLT